MHGSMTKALGETGDCPSVLCYSGGGVVPEDSLPVPSLQAQGPVDGLDQDEDDGLPADQPPHPVQQLAVHHLGLLPGVGEHPLEINLLVAVRTGLLLADNAPAADTELVELVATAESEGVLQDALLVHGHQQLLPAN